MTDDPITHNSLPTSSGRNPDGLPSPISGPQEISIMAANNSMTSGGMRGLGLVAFMIAQIVLKHETVKLAKDYYKTGKKDFDFFKATHQPGAMQSVSEVMNAVTNPRYTPDMFASSPAGLSKSKVVDQRWWAARRRTHRYAVGAQQRLDYEMAVLRASAVVSGWNMGRRYELAWADAHNERRFNKKLAMANVGIGFGNIIRQGLATAVANVAEAQDGLGSTVASIGNGYFRKEGYEDARAETRKRYDETTGRTDNGR